MPELGTVLMVGPPIIAVGVCLIVRPPWKLILSQLLGVPLAATIASIAFPGRGFPILSLSFARAVIGVYAYALIFFGYCPVLLGVIAWRVGYSFEQIRSLNPFGRYLLSALLGGATGSGVMIALLANVARISDPRLPFAWQQNLLLSLTIGVVAGVIAGLLVATSLPHDSPTTGNNANIKGILGAAGRSLSDT